MPCLKELDIEACDELTALPHQLLRKASALEKLRIKESFVLWEDYEDENCFRLEFTHIPHVEIC
ncbi:hypothetical protein CDL12_08774 [Handroanthus impetiginosus]|uniref:Uncharacterized protein n=1 Tax=Handroanthus impetiginosus TaxID=429701 RepID=A0A2G9HM92_9LAMI|nr:hypothetical protein CDL12_08774 [Handroanthus impetiginosus]